MLKEKVISCFEAAASATGKQLTHCCLHHCKSVISRYAFSVANVARSYFQGCKVSTEWDPIRYSSLDTNATLSDLYQANAETLGVTFIPPIGEVGGSTDMGNVSQIIP